MAWPRGQITRIYRICFAAPVRAQQVENFTALMATHGHFISDPAPPCPSAHRCAHPFSRPAFPYTTQWGRARLGSALRDLARRHGDRHEFHVPVAWSLGGGRLVDTLRRLGYEEHIRGDSLFSLFRRGQPEGE